MIDSNHFRELLLQRQADLEALAETNDEASKTVDLDQTQVGRLSRMDAMQGQAMSLETKRRRKQELSRITQALNRLELGEYGECLKCGEDIAVGRLEVDPAATLCINCAQ